MLQSWKWWRRRHREEEELADELQSHLAIETRLRTEGGEESIEAESAARRAFGNTAAIFEESRETWGWSGLMRFLDDAAFGLRMLRKTPAWTAIICVILALGIGLTTAIFSVVYGVMLQPLPYPDPSRVMALWPAAQGGRFQRVNAALWMHWLERSQLFSAIALTRPVANFNLTGDGAPERLQGARISADLAGVLGVPPLYGRFFTEEERSRDAKVAILSHGLWRRRFGADTNLLGRKILLNGEPFEVIGIMPPDFRYPTRDFELWTPLYIPPAELRDLGNYQYLSVGRLKTGITLLQAQSEMDGIMRRLAEEFPGAYRIDSGHLQALIEPLADSDAFQVRGTLYILLAASGCLLLIGCMNLGVLLIARASARAREMAVRAALGASRQRLRRQLLAEIVPLGVLGAACGILLASWTLKALLPFLPVNTPRIDEIGLNGPVLAFAIGISFFIVVLAGLLPAHTGSKGRLTGALQQSSRAVAAGSKTRSVLVVAQIAVTLVLVLGGSLLVRSLAAALRVNTGFSTEHRLTMHLAVTRARYPQDRQIADYYDRLEALIRSIPGVTAAGFVNRLPLSGLAQTAGIEFEGKEGGFDTDLRSATPGYFEAIGIPLQQGRLIELRDREGAPNVGLIDADLARKAFGAESPLGKRFRMFAGSPKRGPWTQVVGVVGHIRNDSPERDTRPQVYWPEAQRTQDRAALVVRTAGPPDSFTAAVLAEIRKENPEQPVYDIRSMTEWLDRSLQSRNLMTALVGLFAGASLLLACLGLYGVVSYGAGLRLREFGIRMALGARANEVRLLVLRHAATLALAGSAAGLAAFWPVGRAIESFLFGVTRSDAVSWALAPALLIVVGLLAGLAPARKAARTDPAITLRLD